MGNMGMYWQFYFNMIKELYSIEKINRRWFKFIVNISSKYFKKLSYNEFLVR